MAAGPAVDQPLEIGRQSVCRIAVGEPQHPSSNPPMVFELDMPAGRLEEDLLAVLGDLTFLLAAVPSLILGVSDAMTVAEDPGIDGKGFGTHSLEDPHDTLPPMSGPPTLPERAGDGPSEADGSVFYCRVLVTTILSGGVPANKTEKALFSLGF